MLQVRQFPALKKNQKLTAGFIVGVATHPYYKKSGYMKQLLNHVLSLNIADFWCLQAYDWNLYRSFGFHEAYVLKKTMLQFDEIIEKMPPCHDAKHLLNLYQLYIVDKDGARIRDLDYYENYFIPYMSIEGTIYANDEAYIVVYENENEVIIHEAIYTNKDALISLLHMFHHPILYSDIYLELEGESEIVNSMMVKDDFELNDHLFIREFL